MTIAAIPEVTVPNVNPTGNTLSGAGREFAQVTAIMSGGNIRLSGENGCSIVDRIRLIPLYNSLKLHLFGRIFCAHSGTDSTYCLPISPLRSLNKGEAFSSSRELS